MTTFLVERIDPAGRRWPIGFREGKSPEQVRAWVSWVHRQRQNKIRLQLDLLEWRRHLAEEDEPNDQIRCEIQDLREELSSYEFAAFEIEEYELDCSKAAP